MKRRHFIHAATVSVLLPAAATPHVAALATISQNWDYVFFDERFQKARRVAASWPASDRLIGVQGDITPVWSNGLKRATREDLLHLRGMTTESFFFCLRILAGEYANLDAQVSRFDRNLFLWTMCTIPKPEYGAIRHG
jgi:hypothetical protein